MRFDGFTNWRLHCFDTSEELLGKEEEKEQSHGQNAGSGF
jgi:hypothetical protein